MKKLLTILLVLFSFTAMAQPCTDEDTVRSNAVTLITATTVRVNGSISHFASGYTTLYMMYVRVGQTDTATASGVSPLRNLTGLQPNTQYYYYYKTICVSGTNRQLGPYYFTTAVNTIVYATERSTVFPYVKTDSGFKVPRQDTSLFRAPNTSGGDIVFKTSDSTMYYYNGTRWTPMAVDSGGYLALLNNKVDSVTVDSVTNILYYWKQGVSYGYALPLDSAYVNGVAINDSTIRMYRLSGDSTEFILRGTSGGATGTVTSVATTGATGLRGGTITTSGTLYIDTLLISTRAWRQKGIDSVAALITGGSGSNTSIGSGYKIAVNVNATNIKSLAGSNGIVLDSATTGQIGFKADTLLLSTRAWRKKLADSLGNLIGAKTDTLNDKYYIPNYINYSRTATIVGFGTSITRGYLTTVKYLDSLGTLLNLTVDNNGVDGRTLMKQSPHNPFGGGAMTDNLADIPRADTGSVIIYEFGANDFGANAPNYSPANFKLAYDTVLLATLNSGWLPRQIVLFAPSWITQTGFNTYAALTGRAAPTQARLDSFRQAVKDVSIKYNTIFIDMYSSMRNNGDSTMDNSDGLHPNSTGQSIMAQAGFQTLKGNLYAAISGTNYWTKSTVTLSPNYSTTASVSTATPVAIDLGGTYASSAGDPAKLKILTYNDGTNKTGVGTSFLKQEYFTFTGGSHRFNAGSTNIFEVDAGGMAGTQTALHFGPGSAIDDIEFNKTVAGAFGSGTRNYNASGSAYHVVRNDVGYAGLFTYGSSYATTALRRTLNLQADNQQTNGINITTDATAPITFNIGGTEKGRFHTNGFLGVSTAAPDSALHIVGGIYGTRGVRFTGLPTGPAAKRVMADANGTLYLSDSLAAAGGTNIYNSDGTLTGDRIVDGNGNDLTFTGSTGTPIFNVEYNKIILTSQNSGITIQGDSIILDAESHLIHVDSLLQSVAPTNKMVVWDSVGKKLYSQAIPTGGGLSASNFVFNEVPSGTINGINTTFTLANTPTAGTVRVFLRGLRMKLTTDYTISGSTITMINIPGTGDDLITDYLK